METSEKARSECKNRRTQCSGIGGRRKLGCWKYRNSVNATRSRREHRMKAEAFSNWIGTWKAGSGSISTRTPTVKQQPFSYASRFQGAPGASPEELLAASHAGCFNQALANNLGKASLVADSVITKVEIELVQNEYDSPTILSSHITVEAKVPGTSHEQFAECAEHARANCSISRILKCPITMFANLIA
jgi:osmotically inducible protein OsmC